MSLSRFGSRAVIISGAVKVCVPDCSQRRRWEAIWRGIKVGSLILRLLRERRNRMAHGMWLILLWNYEFILVVIIWNPSSFVACKPLVGFYAPISIGLATADEFFIQLLVPVFLGPRFLKSDCLSTHRHGHQTVFNRPIICACHRLIFVCANRLLVLAKPVALEAQINLFPSLLSSCKNIINIKIAEETLLVCIISHLHSFYCL